VDEDANGNAVAADPFGDGMHHDIRAKHDGAAEIWGCEGVVDEERNARAMGDFGNLGDVEHFKAGIADGLRDNEPAVGTDGGAETIEVAWLYEGGGDTEARQCGREKIDGAAVQRSGRDDVVSCAEQRSDAQVHRRHAARRADRAYTALQRCEPFFKYGGGGVGDAGIDMSGTLEIEQRRRVI